MPDTLTRRRSLFYPSCVIFIFLLFFIMSLSFSSFVCPPDRFLLKTLPSTSFSLLKLSVGILNWSLQPVVSLCQLFVLHISYSLFFINHFFRILGYGSHLSFRLSHPFFLFFRPFPHFPDVFLSLY